MAFAKRGPRGEITATPVAILYASFWVVCTLGSSSLCGHIIKTTGATAHEFLDLILPYEIGAALALVAIFEASASASTASPTATPTARSSMPTATSVGAFSPRYLASLGLNGMLACLVIFLTTWSQGVSSNML